MELKRDPRYSLVLHRVLLIQFFLDSNCRSLFKDDR